MSTCGGNSQGSEQPRAKKLVFLDRDGTINIDHGYVHLVADWQFAPAAELALKLLQDAGLTLAIVTNQSGVACGKYSQSDIESLHSHMQSLLAEFNVRIAAIAFCPHGVGDGCRCRKPLTGLAKDVEAEVGPIDYDSSWTIGDKITDAAFGRTLGTKVALIRSRYWRADDLSLPTDVIADSLFDAVQQILGK